MSETFEYEWGPCGACPTQGSGVILETGEKFDFHYRSGRVRFWVYGPDSKPYDDATAVSFFRMRVGERPGMQMLLDEVNCLTEKFVSLHLATGESRDNQRKE